MPPAFPSRSHKTIAYVDRGGYPRRKNEVRPPYVREMVEKLGPLLI